MVPQSIRSSEWRGRLAHLGGRGILLDSSVYGLHSPHPPFGGKREDTVCLFYISNDSFMIKMQPLKAIITKERHRLPAVPTSGQSSLFVVLYSHLIVEKRGQH